MKNTTKASIALALFWVIFLWGFWTRGVFALGINASIFLAGLTIFFVWVLKSEGRYQRSDLDWIIPFVLLALSFALYENPFFKVATLLVVPPLFALFYNHANIIDKNAKPWNLHWLGLILERIFSPIMFIGRAFSSLTSLLTFTRGEERSGLAKRVAIGGLLLVIALLIILPLLSSADPAFATKLGGLTDLISEIFSSSFIGKLVVFVVLAVATLAMALGWGRASELVHTTEEKTVDALVSGIVLVGILVFYLLFIWVQLDRLWVGSLPFAFAETEHLVKSGFWQLMFLSTLNLGIFFVLYRRTIATIQRVLSVFTVASFLMLTSAGHRMILYVTNYGYSYEKFYALYAVLFCAILFIWLFSRLFVARRSNVIKFVAFQFLWMFALVSVMPVELFILRTNVALFRRPDSRIILHEMNMLSPDVLRQVKEYQANGILVDPVTEVHNWDSWAAKQRKRLDDKRWYEYTVSAIAR